MYEGNGSIEQEFRDVAMTYIEKLADGNYGLATTIAKQATENKKKWNTWGKSFSEKQAYVMAKALYDNKLIGGRKNDHIFEIYEPKPKAKKKTPNPNRMRTKS